MFIRRPGTVEKLIDSGFIREIIDILDPDEFFARFNEDLKDANDQVLIFSPFVAKEHRFPKINEILREVVERGTKVKLIIRPDQIVKKGSKLFSIDASLAKENLNKGVISGELNSMFKTKRFPLSENATIRKEKDDKWEITNGEKSYIIEKDRRGKLINIYNKTLISELKEAGVEIYGRDSHIKAVIIDDKVLYIGSLNILSQWDKPDVMVRFSGLTRLGFIPKFLSERAKEKIRPPKEEEKLGGF